MFLTAI